MSDQLTSLLTQFNLSQDNLEKPCSDNLLLTLSQEVPSFEVAAPYFGCAQAVIEEIHQDHDKERSKKLHMLWNWKRRNGSDATYLAIVTIFLKMEDRVLAELVLKTQCCEITSIAIDSHVNPGRVSRYGNWEALNEVEKEQIKNTLISENEIIRTEFAFLSDEILCSFEQRAIQVDRLKLFIVNYGVPLSKLENAFTLAAVMLILHGYYISWFNTTSFKRCVMRFGSDDDQEKMRVYETEHLAPYLQRSIFEIPSKSFASGDGNTDLVSLFLFIPDDIVLTGHDVVKIGCNLCRILGVKDGIIHFIGYEPGSTILIFGMPQALICISLLQTLERYFTIDLDKKACTFKNDFLDQILPPEIHMIESPFHIKSKEEVLFDIKPPPIIKRHPNGAKVAEAIDRMHSVFSTTTGNIAAIDFGTANCSLAYCTTEDEEMELLKVTTQEGQVRVPTILLVNEEGEPIDFGYGAIHQYQRLDPSQQMKYHLFERIKLALGPDEEICRDTKISDVNSKKFFLRDVIAVFIKCLKDEFENTLTMRNIDDPTDHTSDSKTDGVLKATDFHWVITVPAIWSASGKQMMREAAYQAGLCGTPSIEQLSRSVHSQKQKLKVTYPERLSLAFEPEAASFYCRNMKDHDIAEYCKPAAQIPEIDKYIVVDIGAGTADISAHGVTSEGNIEVLTSPEGNLCGGVAVNKEFEYFLSQLVCDPDFSTYTSTLDEAVNAVRTLNVRNIIYTNFEEEKTRFGEQYMSRYVDKMIDPAHETFNVKLFDFYDFYLERLQRGIHRLNSKDDGKVTLKNKMLVIHYSIMEEFFDHPFRKILIILKNCLERLDNMFRTIYLVGGFGGCQYMYYRVEEALKQLYVPNGFRIIVPKRPHLAVVEGAFQYRKNPQLVRSRVAKATYGTEVMSSFDDKIHDRQYLHTTRFGIHKCKYLFSPLIIEGERVEFDKVKRNIFYPTEPDHTCVGFELLVTNKKDLFYTRDPNGDLKNGVNVLGAIFLPSPNTEQGTDRKIYLTFDFSHTEIQVRAYDESSNTERRAVIDCLQRQP